MARTKQEKQEGADVHPDEVDTVAMVRDEPQHAGGPVTADVHPDEVENYKAAGWNVAE